MTDLLWIFSRLDWGDVLIDIPLVALAVFLLLYLVRTTQAVPLLRGIILLIAIIGLFSNVFQLTAFSWLLLKALPALLVSIPVIFQPELRRALERMGRVGAVLGAGGEREEIEALIDATVLACRSLTARRHGALIILERETGLQEYADTGVMLNADYSVELLLTVFDPNTPLHDGGVIVRSNRILAAACVLPLTTAFLADRRLGLRHRAGIGVTEATDAIAIIVSEERGAISIAHNGRIIRRLDAERLGAVLRAFYQSELRRAVPLSLAWFRRHFGRDGARAKGPGESLAGRTHGTREAEIAPAGGEERAV
jgi:diadenylate cyclase